MISIQKRPLPTSDPSAAQWTQRRFYKKTARGKVQKIIRERYLRDDVSCGRQGCEVCQTRSQPSQEGRSEGCTMLQGTGSTSNTSDLGNHFIVLDTNVVLHQMDLLESNLGDTSSPPFTNVIILQTVLDEVRHRSLPLYNRLFALIREPERHWWIYWNDFSSQTATTRLQDESPNDRNDRSIREAVKWYASHFISTKAGKKALRVVLLTDDAANLALARKDSLQAMTVREYVSQLSNAPQLLDLLASRSLEEPMDASGNARRGTLYPPHLEGSSLTAAISSGRYVSGFFNANPYNYLEGTVRIASMDKPVLLVGREAMNRAVDGDIVAVEILPKEEWKREADEVLDADVALQNDDAEGSEDEEGGKEDLLDEGATNKEKKASNDSSKVAQPTGKVVGIVKRNWRSYVAHIDAKSVHASALSSLTPSSLLVIPLDRKIPRIRLRTRQAAALVGQKILVSLDDWKGTSRYPDGHFVRALGKVESQEAEQESLLLEHDIPYRPFSQAILNCLPPEGESWTVPPFDQSHPAWRKRIDLRQENICSIDPPGCQDIDDALHAKRLPNGNIEAGVHIADVSYFVKPETPMDKEAASRGTTVYLVDRRIDMLPHLLGTNLCSLRPHVERLAFSAIWEMTEEGDVVKVDFFKSVIASKSAFTYEEAQLRKDDSSRKDAITESIRLLNKLAIKLKEKRMKAGALNLASPEVRIHLESAESVGPIDVEQKEMRETNSLVEEFMLLANVAVARRIYQHFPQTAVLRRHAPPPSTNFETLRDILKKRRGMDLDVSSSGALAASLDECVDKNNPAFNTLVRIMATRCMLSAEYFCSGSVSAETFGHYGLACDMYTHFTSPIRRMADVLTHRQLSASVDYEGLDPSLHSKSHVENILNVVNKRHRSAQMAARASVEYWVGLAIKRKNEEKGGDAQTSVQLIEEAYVIRAFRNGVAVFVTSFGLEGLITFSKDCIFDADEFKVTVPKDVSGFDKDMTLGIFDKCKVSIGIKKDKNTQRSVVAMALVPLK
jgi:exosome complex exonuclease DIS3/RRP44